VVKKLKSEIERTIDPAVAFIRSIKPKEKVSVIHDDDCDGICSGSIIAILAKKLLAHATLLSTEWNESLTKDVATKVKKKKPSKVIILDCPEIPRNVLDVFGSSDVLIVDHHKLEKYAGVTYCNPRKFDKDIYLPTSYLAYKIFEKFFNTRDILWFAASGTLGDMGLKDCTELFTKLRIVYPELIGNADINDELFDNSLLGTITKIISSASAVKGRIGAEFVSSELIKVKNYREFLNVRKPLEWYNELETEFDRCLKDFEMNKKVVGRLVFYELKSKLRIKSILATSLARYHSNKIIIIGQEYDGQFGVSLRRGESVNIDLADLVKNLIKGIPKARGGGHPAAAAGSMPNQYKCSFLRKLDALEA
jgi:single-stranded DNA-specific DHH superfamily exonuclease